MNLNTQTNVPSGGVSVQKQAVNFDNMLGLLYQCLPEQGAFEVQNDQPGKEHAWHSHDTDETIIVLDGSLRFYWEGNETICSPGDVIELPKRTRHGSVALDDGAKYIITFEHVALENV